MSLSAQGLLKLLNEKHRRYEVFEQISLAEAASGAALSSRRVLRGSVVVPEADNHSAGGGGITRVIPTATVVVRTPSPQLLQLPWPLSQPQASTPTQAHGRMYVCELPEDTWNLISAVAATSAPSQRQFAFANEAPAFCTSQNPSIVDARDGSTGESSVQASPTTATVTAISTLDHTDHTEEVREEPESLSNHDRSVSTSGLGPSSVATVGGIQLPQLSSPTGQRVMELPASPQALQTAGEDVRNALNAALVGCRGADANSTPPQSPQRQSPGAAAVEASVGKQNNTVAVVLWVAGDAATTGAVDTTDMGQVGDALYTLAAAPLGTPSLRRDPQRMTSTATAPQKAASAASTTAESTEDIAGGSTQLPGCLCFAVRDIHEAESSVTDMLTPRDRRVQMLTLQLESGAAVYAAKCPSDVFVRVGSNSPGCALTSPSEISSGAVALSSRPSAPTVSVSFVFHKGGITRCMAALRQHSPGLVYACRGSRNNLSLLLQDGANGATSADGISTWSPSRIRGASNPSELPASHGVHRLGSVHLGLPLSPAGGSTSSAGAQPTQPPEDEMHGWRQRLSTHALFRSGARGVGDMLSNYTSNSRYEAVGGVAPHWPSALTKFEQEADHTDDRRGRGDRRVSSATRARASATNSPDEAQDYSSASSFEDLTDEMTAIRLGACYSPPRPVLPVDGGSRTPSPVTAADWERVFDVPPEQQRHPHQHGDLPESHNTHGATSTALPPQTRRLNADRYRAFRQAVYERGGLKDSSIRFEVWCYLLGAYRVGSTEAEQAEALRSGEALYTRLTSQWKSFLPEQEAHFATYRYAKQSIVKDVQRTDRAHPAFREDDSDMLRVLQELLLAHVMLDMDLGYSQGMSDVAAVVLLAALPSLPPAPHLSPASEAAMFMCFRKILSEHMSANFVIEGRTAGAPYAAVKGLQRKLYQAQVLTRHFHPGLYTHLKKNCMADDMSFCFRWILVCFKRDLPSIEDTMRFWDVLFACPYTTSYEVVVTVALLGALAAQIITHIQAYETLLQFTNGLRSEISLDQIVVCARAFYENVCVAETRELRRRLRLQNAEAAARTRGSAATGGAGEPLPGWYVGPHSKAAAVAAAVPPGKVDDDDDESDYFPSVEDMVALFLKTDGPL
ncbi:conserved hypothetical protein [Leishmania major strain Friedlin]|uniref:Rab-GAP TBC domain-containing protein n=1 Tax=Leishmania major TaxID=5664 RepID=Q4QBU4_LEIMA|nr:conserved hypothetical protein [Leishmania major strain Friedlin]CAG9573919.1 Rab-GTPase-TBC_domain_containing_protein_-_putative [Leishmania major strain Friedlin]CAJ04147.1 conserved hypothetical protein [Leishmania major strain Friedlin]|eukprot:XP_001683204.1 conserved hypothetical protein [Leishmania major strain Friedlin]